MENVYMANPELLDSVRYYLQYYKNVEQIARAIGPKIMPEVVVDLLTQIKDNPDAMQVLINYYGNFYIGENRFLAIADPHIGGDFECLSFLTKAYDYAVNHNIKYIINGGDIIEGKSNKFGNGKEIETQIQLALDNYPSQSGITTYYIQGNHDFNTLWAEGVTVRYELSNIPNLYCIGTCKSYLNLLGTHAISLNHPIKRYEIKVPVFQTELDFYGHKHFYIPSEYTRQIHIPTISTDLKGYDDNYPGFLDIRVTDDEYISDLYTFESEEANPKYISTTRIRIK